MPKRWTHLHLERREMGFCNGRGSRREAREPFLERCERLNGKINAVIALDADGSRKSSRELGPLHGLPIDVQIVPDDLQDHTTIGFARLLAERIGGSESRSEFR